MRIFVKRKVYTHSQVRIFGKGKCKLIANFSANNGDVTSVWKRFLYCACSPCARDRKVVSELAIGPLARDRNRPFVRRSRESGVDRGDDGLARRVCLLFRLSSVSFSFIS